MSETPIEGEIQPDLTDTEGPAFEEVDNEVQDNDNLDDEPPAEEEN